MIVHCLGAGYFVDDNPIPPHMRKTAFLILSPCCRHRALHPMATNLSSHYGSIGKSMFVLFVHRKLAGGYSRKAWLWVPVSLLCTLLAATTKEVGLMLPFVLYFSNINSQIAYDGNYNSCLASFGCACPYVWFDQCPRRRSNAMGCAAKFFPRESDRSMGTQLLTQSEVWLRYIMLWSFLMSKQYFTTYLIANSIPFPYLSSRCMDVDVAVAWKSTKIVL